MGEVSLSNWVAFIAWHTCCIILPRSLVGPGVPDLIWHPCLACVAGELCTACDQSPRGPFHSARSDMQQWPVTMCMLLWPSS